MSSRRTFVGVFRALFTNILKLPLNFLATYFIAKALGAENYGSLVVAMSYPMFLVCFFNLGIDRSLVYFFPEPDQLRPHSLAILLISLTTGTIFFCLFLAIDLWAGFGVGSSSDLIMIFALYTVATALNRTIAAMLRVYEERWLAVSHDTVLTPGLMCVASFILWLRQGVNPSQLAYAHLLSIVITTVVLIHSLHRVQREFGSWSSQRFQYGKLLRLGLPLGAAATLNNGVSTICIIVAANFIQTPAIATFAIALKLNFLTSLAITALNPFLSVALARLGQAAKWEELSEMRRKNGQILMIWTSLSILFLGLFGRECLSFFAVGNEDYHFFILTFVTTATAITNLSNFDFQTCSMLGLSRSTFALGVLTGIVTALLTWGCTVWAGPIGPGIAFSIGQLPSIIFRQHIMRQAAQFRSSHREFWLIILASLVLVIAIDWVQLTLEFRIILFALLILGFLSRSLNLLKDLLRR